MNLRICGVALALLTSSCTSHPGHAHSTDHAHDGDASDDGSTHSDAAASDAGKHDSGAHDAGMPSHAGDDAGDAASTDAGHDSGPMPPDPLAMLPSKARIEQSMRLVNDYFIAHHQDPGDNLWARGVYFVGDMAAYRALGEQNYLDYANGWAEKHDWSLSGGASTRHADNQTAGQTYLELAKLAPDDHKIAMIDASLSAMVSSDKSDDWWWCDALFMSMPSFVKLGVLHNDTSYHDKMYALFDHAKTEEGGAGLYDTGDHLWWRDKGFVAPHVDGHGKDVFWARGNGWVFGALSRVLEELPASDAHRSEYEQTFRDMAKALLTVQREDGFWNPSLHDPDEYGGPETSGTALFTFGLAWGMRRGLLDAETYAAPAAHAFEAMAQTAVHSDGFLGYVQGVGYEPASSQPITSDTTSDFGVGAFLLAGSALYALTPNKE